MPIAYIDEVMKRVISKDHKRFKHTLYSAMPALSFPSGTSRCSRDVATTKQKFYHLCGDGEEELGNYLPTWKGKGLTS